MARTQEIGTPNVNTHEYWVIFQPSDGSPSVRVNLASTEAAIDITTAPQQVGKVTTYLVTAYVKDYYDTVSQFVEVPTVERILNFGADGESMAVGKIAERKGLEVAWDALFQNIDVIDKVQTLANLGIPTVTPFTPTLYGMTTAGTPTYSGRQGIKINIGKFVILFFTAAISAKNGMAGRLAFRYPSKIAANNQNNDQTGFAWWPSPTGTPQYITLRATPNADYGLFLRGADLDALNVEHFGATFGISGTIMYIEE